MSTTSILSKLVSDIARQKQLYHEKTMTPDAEWINYLRFLEIYDYYVDLSHIIIPEFMISALSSLITFGINPWEFDVFTLYFDIRIPTLDEMLRGINIVIDKTTIEYTFEKLGIEEDFSDFIKQHFEPEIVAQIMPEKCVYGVSRYGMCFVDPQTMREFLKNTLLLMFRKHKDWESRRREIKALAKTLDISEDIVESIHDRIELIMKIYIEMFTLNYSRLNISKLASDNGIVSIVSYIGESKDVSYNILTDILMGCILDIGVLDQCYLLPEKSVFRLDNIELPAIFNAIDVMIKHNIDRFLYTPMALANYATGSERIDFRKAQRTETWGQLMTMRYIVDAHAISVVKNLLPNADNFTINKYVTALRQFFGHITKRHRWGMKIYGMLDIDLFKKYWVEYWSSMGLDRDVLETLYNNVSDWIRHLAIRKREIGRRVRASRGLTPI